MDILIRPFRDEDFDAVVALDAAQTGAAKPDYWKLRVNRQHNRPDQNFILLAVAGDGLQGYIVGEIRAWEFGLDRSGWIVDVMVSQDARQGRVGSRLFDALCAKFKQAGVHQLRTSVSRTNTRIMAFFRSQGMMAAPIIEMEMDLDHWQGGAE